MVLDGCQVLVTKTGNGKKLHVRHALLLFLLAQWSDARAVGCVGARAAVPGRAAQVPQLYAEESLHSEARGASNAQGAACPL